MIFGHLLADNDRHILRCISTGAVSHLLVGLHGPLGTDGKDVANDEHPDHEHRINRGAADPRVIGRDLGVTTAIESYGSRSFVRASRIFTGTASVETDLSMMIGMSVCSKLLGW